MNRWLLFAINGWAGHSALLDRVMLVCARDLVFAVFAVALAWWLLALQRRQLRAATLFVVNLVVAFALLLVASHAFIEARPFVTWHLTQLMAHAADQSFPSDHTTAASAIAFGFILFARRWKLGMALLAAALLIGFSRVFAGVHYPGDILGGVAIAAVAAGIVYAAARVCWPDRGTRTDTRSWPTTRTR